MKTNIVARIAEGQITLEVSNKTLLEALNLTFKAVMENHQVGLQLVEEVVKNISNPAIEVDVLMNFYHLSIFVKLAKKDTCHFTPAEDDLIAYLLGLFSSLKMKKMELYQEIGLLLDRTFGSIQQRIVLLKKENRLYSPFVNGTLEDLNVAIAKEIKRLLKTQQSIVKKEEIKKQAALSQGQKEIKREQKIANITDYQGLEYTQDRFGGICVKTKNHA